MEVIWSKTALRHLGDIVQYVADNFGQTYALKSVERIQKKVESLRRFPESGVLDRRFSTKDYTVHHISLAPNVLYYVVFPEAVVIGIIVHTKRSPRYVNRLMKDFLEHYER